ncbi:hypothetical protein ZIOFF_031890 [Zingiber officinale]|uniref:Uncharacterized protein n=1 Tax=Zingiber officinale TaxID=94328 RepID=A0A8J5GIA2_ZINOF|nr:hypothetical protein ZIOFF_031890 [Zingiber officinale]
MEGTQGCKPDSKTHRVILKDGVGDNIQCLHRKTMQRPTRIDDGTKTVELPSSCWYYATLRSKRTDPKLAKKGKEGLRSLRAHLYEVLREGTALAQRARVPVNLSATDPIENPSIGFAKPSDYQDQIRSYRRNQRRLYNTQQAARRLGRQLTGGTSSRYTLEQQLEPEAQLELSMQERASIVPAEVLYHSRRDDSHHRVYVHRSEEAILVTDNHQVD